MKTETRHHIAATLISAATTFATTAALSTLSGISFEMIATSGYPGAVYLALFALAFGWPEYILIRVILAKKLGVPYAARRKR